MRRVQRDCGTRSPVRLGRRNEVPAAKHPIIDEHPRNPRAERRHSPQADGLHLQRAARHRRPLAPRPDEPGPTTHARPVHPPRSVPQRAQHAARRRAHRRADYALHLPHARATRAPGQYIRSRSSPARDWSQRAPAHRRVRGAPAAGARRCCAPNAGASARARLRLVSALPLPSRWEMEQELARRLMSIGVVKSALELFVRLELWADAVQCYAARSEALVPPRRPRRALRFGALLQSLGNLTPRA